jgi:hypothetical protein
MTNRERLEQIRRATAAAVEAYRARQPAVAAGAGRPPRPGDVYLFPGPAAIDLSWVVLAGPDEDGLVFAVPGDGHPLAGLSDVVVESSASGPLVLRCGHGLWVLADELRPGWRVGTLEESHVARAARKLAQVAAGKLEGTAAQWEAEANPDYDGWLAEVDRTVDALAGALRLREEEVTVEDFSRTVRPASPPEWADVGEPQLAAAAAGAGPLAELLESLAQAPPGGPPARRLDFLYPGELFLVLESGGVAVLYVRAGDHAPPELHEIDAAGGEHPAAWQFTPNNTAARAGFAWRDGRVRLRLGRGPHAREVTVRQ